MTAAPQQPDPLEWVRVAIDGLRHSQNIAVGVLGGGMALLAAVFGGFMIWQADQIKDLRTDIKDLGKEISDKIDRLDVKLTDTRERVIRLEERSKEGPP
jgi:hypothetical protein